MLGGSAVGKPFERGYDLTAAAVQHEVDWRLAAETAVRRPKPPRDLIAAQDVLGEDSQFGKLARLTSPRATSRSPIRRIGTPTGDRAGTLANNAGNFFEREPQRAPNIVDIHRN